MHHLVEKRQLFWICKNHFTYYPDDESIIQLSFSKQYKNSEFWPLIFTFVCIDRCWSQALGHPMETSTDGSPHSLINLSLRRFWEMSHCAQAWPSSMVRCLFYDATWCIMGRLTHNSQYPNAPAIILSFVESAYLLSNPFLSKPLIVFSTQKPFWASNSL